MNVIDSSGWIEYFVNGTNARFFAPPIEDTENLIVPTICLYEVFKRVLLNFDKLMLQNYFQESSELFKQAKSCFLDVLVRATPEWIRVVSSCML